MYRIGRMSPLVVAGCVTVIVAGCGGCGGASMVGAPALTVPAGLARSTAVPPVHDGDDADINTQFPPVSAALRRVSAESISELVSDSYVKSVSGSLDDGALSITYMVGGDEATVEFTSADVTRTYPNGGIDWEGMDDRSISIWANAWQSNQENIIFVLLGRGQHRIYATAGIRTAAASMPSGSAQYTGHIYGNSYLRDDPSNANRRDYTGGLSLTANFDDHTLEGSVENIRSRDRDPQGSSLPWVRLPGSTTFMIHDGQIVDGQFTANLTGMDSNANAPMDLTVQGYEGGILGEFYGPDAEEVGGVFNAARVDRVMIGEIGGVKDEQQ